MNKDIKIYNNPIDAAQVEAFVYDVDCGGIVSFIGTVRNATNGKSVVRLEFESFVPMAIKELDKIADTIFENWPVKKLAIHHRVGNLEIGEVAVVIAIACPHRKNAFEACAYAIDMLKKTVPIWKKEIFEDGEVWVSAHP